MFTEADAKRVGGWTMPFGKYKGMKFRDIDDADYIEWIVEKTDFFKDDKYPSNKFIREYLKLYLDDDDRIFFSKEEKEECLLSDSSDDEEEYKRPFTLSYKNDYKLSLPCTILLYNGDTLLECGGKLWSMTEKYDHRSVCKHTQIGEYA